MATEFVDEAEVRRLVALLKAGEAFLTTEMPAWRQAQIRAVYELRAERDGLRAALEFYADEDNYDGFAPVECRVADDGEDGGCEYDKGNIARAVLRAGADQEGQASDA